MQPGEPTSHLSELQAWKVGSQRDVLQIPLLPFQSCLGLLVITFSGGAGSGLGSSRLLFSPLTCRPWLNEPRAPECREDQRTGARGGRRQPKLESRVRCLTLGTQPGHTVLREGIRFPWTRPSASSPNVATPGPVGCQNLCLVSETLPPSSSPGNTQELGDPHQLEHPPRAQS